jgi:hypothetical protein
MVAVVGRVDLACERAPSAEIGVLPGGSLPVRPHIPFRRIPPTALSAVLRTR